MGSYRLGLWFFKWQHRLAVIWNIDQHVQIAKNIPVYNASRSERAIVNEHRPSVVWQTYIFMRVQVLPFHPCGWMPAYWKSFPRKFHDRIQFLLRVNRSSCRICEWLAWLLWVETLGCNSSHEKLWSSVHPFGIVIVDYTTGEGRDNPVCVFMDKLSSIMGQHVGDSYFEFVHQRVASLSR